MSNKYIAILDFGSQYTHLIARRVRELGVKSEILPNDIDFSDLREASGIILSGGPRSIVREEKLKIDEQIFDSGIPILGLCYGHQLIADFFGGEVESGTSREYGVAELKLSDSPIFSGIISPSTVWMSHGDHVGKLPNNFIQIATTGNDSVAGMMNEEKKIYGFQFHPEVHHSKHGMKMLENFVFNICQTEKNWTVDSMLSNLQDQIKKEAGDKNVFLLVSGGVDSTVCFALLEKTLGTERVYGLHVDHGFMREGESEEVKNALVTIGLDDLHIYNAEDHYLSALSGIIDPEEKRKIIGEKFIDIVEDVMAKMNFDENQWLLGQGTIYPDTIESGGTKNADKIKTHHNRVDRIQKMIAENKIIEPIKDLYKDEVREVGRALGLPSELIDRHPFPGPGLAIRCLCSEGKHGSVDSIPPPIRGRRGGGLVGSPQTPQIYKLPIKSVGVQGDERSYAHPALLMTKKIDFAEIEKIAPQITNEHKDINRVLIPVFGDLEKIQQSKMYTADLNKKRTDLLRKIDKMVNKYCNVDPLFYKIWQMPIILVPFGYHHGESIVLRPFESREVMTASFGKLSEKTIQKIITYQLILDNIDFVFYDVTNKPPGTIEWE